MFLGLTGYNHESSAALIDEEGKLINYYREESLTGIKGDKAFPKKSIHKILDSNNLTLNQISNVTFYERPLSSFLHTLKVAALNMPKSLKLVSHQLRNFDRSSISCYLDIAKEFSGLESKLFYVDHHLSHTLTSLCYTNNKKDICSVVIDGFGDRSTTSISQVTNPTEIKELWSCKYPVSIGLFYSSITDYLGFAVNEGEYKVMGLSAFGDSDSKSAKLVNQLMHWDEQNKELKADMSFFSYHTSLSDSYSEKLVKLLGPPRNPFKQLNPGDSDFQRCANIARGAQDLTIKLICKLFSHAHQLTKSRRFLFSGGVAMNSASLDQISQLPFINEIVIPPSPGDAGSSIGSAYYGFLKSNSTKKEKIIIPSLFPSVINHDHQEKIAENIINNEFIILQNNKEDALLNAAQIIKSGEVIGTIVSNGETGPRALGHRSLVCNGKDIDAVKRLNTVIKNRSPFRPTAPAMTIDTARKYYQLRDELMDSYRSMTATCFCLKDSISLNFPTTHVDGSARLQIVDKGSFLDALLLKLEPLEVEILANSSLNVSGDPTSFDLIDGLMVCSRTPLRYLLTHTLLLEYKR